MDKKSLYLKLPYQINIVPERLDEDTNEVIYVASCPELIGLMSHGSTADEARENLRDAKELYISTLIDSGIEPPLPNVTSTAFSAGTLTWTNVPVRQTPEQIAVDAGVVKQAEWKLRQSIPTTTSSGS